MRDARTRVPPPVLSPHVVRARMTIASSNARPFTCSPHDSASHAVHDIMPHNMHSAHNFHRVESPNPRPKTTCALSLPLIALTLILLGSSQNSNAAPRVVRSVGHALPPNLNFLLVEHLNPSPNTTCPPSHSLVALIPTIPSSASASNAATCPAPSFMPLTPALPATMTLNTHNTIISHYTLLHSLLLPLLPPISSLATGPHTLADEPARPRAHDGALGHDPSASALGDEPIQLYTNIIAVHNTNRTKRPERPYPTLEKLKAPVNTKRFIDPAPHKSATPHGKSHSSLPHPPSPQVVGRTVPPSPRGGGGGASPAAPAVPLAWEPRLRGGACVGPFRSLDRVPPNKGHPEREGTEPPGDPSALGIGLTNPPIKRGGSARTHARLGRSEEEL